MTEMKAEVLDTRRLLEKLRSTDTAFRVFGAHSHRYRIGRVLSDTEIRTFEERYSVSLPVDYRLYLELVGNGGGGPAVRPPDNKAPWQVAGAGPGYGIYPLSMTVNGNRVGEPFPFESEVTLPFIPPYDEWDDNIPGALEISTDGCSSHTHLVVKGPTAGTIWEGYDYDHFSPANVTFIQWIRNWAERALRILANDALVDKLAVGMSKAQVVAAVGGDWQERRNRVTPEYYFEATEIPAQLILREDDRRVIRIKRWPFV